MVPPHVSDPRYQQAAIDFLQLLFGGAYREDFAIRLWTGVTLPETRETRFTLDISTPYALRAAFMPPLDLNPGRALVNGLLDISGDVEAAVELLERAFARLPARRLPAVICRLLRMPKPPASADCGNVRLRGRRHSRKRDRAAISFHYDQPVEFYASFLDRDLVYSCGYFEDAAMSLDDAQLAKIDYILRKLQLLPDDRLLDVGCGWGALVMRAAERFGAQAVGITLSRAQYEVAQRRIAERGLQERASVKLRDYRDLQAELPYDKIVSVGMFEHVGRTNLTAYFDAAYAALRPGADYSSITGSRSRAQVDEAESRPDLSTDTSFPTPNWSQFRTDSALPSVSVLRCATSRTYANTTPERCVPGLRMSNAIARWSWRLRVLRPTELGDCTWQAARRAFAQVGSGSFSRFWRNHKPTAA